MEKDPVLVPPCTPVYRLAQMMVERHIHRIVVADMGAHRPLGIVSSMDILAAIARVGQPSTSAEKHEGFEAPIGAWS